MHSEHYYMPQATADLINKTKERGGRVIAVGTTSCRTIESVAQREGCFQESAGWTDIFLYPGCEFQGVDALSPISTCRRAPSSCWSPLWRAGRTSCTPTM